MGVLVKKGCLIAVGMIFVGLMLWKISNPKQDKSPSKDTKIEMSASAAQQLPAPLEHTEQSPPAQEPELSENVKVIVEGNNYNTILAAIKQLGTDLSAHDVAALCSFLEHPLSDYPDERPIDINSLKNEILELLLDQQQLPQGIGQQLIDMFQNDQTDPMWREYCMQFAGPTYQKLTNNLRSDPQSEIWVQEQKAIKALMLTALDQRDSDLAATALIGLHNLSQENNLFDKQVIIDKAVEIATDPTASKENRITALRMAAAKGRSEILPAARELAQNGESDTIRGAAIVTLGELGDFDEDHKQLERLSRSTRRQIKLASETALKKMVKRMESETEQ